MGLVFGIVNQKGGVGKTTTVVNLSASMAAKGAKVLVVDLDPQANATSGLGIERHRLESSIYNMLVEDVEAGQIIHPTSVHGLSVLPATMDLAGAEIELIGRISREGYLKRALEPLKAEFDAILIDAPPSLGLLTLNALVAADALIIPIQAEYFALEGISQLIKTVDLVRRQLNPSLDVASVLVTMFDNRIRLANQVVDEVREYFGERVSKTLIPRNVRLSEAPSHGMPVTQYAPRSRGAIAYSQIAQEILEYGKARTR